MSQNKRYNTYREFARKDEVGDSSYSVSVAEYSRNFLLGVIADQLERIADLMEELNIIKIEDGKK